MVRIRRQQIYVLFVLIMLFGAWFVASAVMSVVEVAQPKQQLVFDGPLSNSDEAVFFQQNKVIARYFWSANCTECPAAEEMVDTLFQDFQGNLVIEKIDIDKWSDFAQTLDITSLPMLYLKGKTIDIMEGEITYNDAYERICALFFDPIDLCGTFG